MRKYPVIYKGEKYEVCWKKSSSLYYENGKLDNSRILVIYKEVNYFHKLKIFREVFRENEREIIRQLRHNNVDMEDNEDYYAKEIIKIF